MHRRLDLAVDARAVYDAAAAIDACKPEGCSIKLHLISVRDRFAQGIIRRMHWVDTRDMRADGLTKGGIFRAWSHRVSNDCAFKLAHRALTHVKASLGSTTNPSNAGTYSARRSQHHRSIGQIIIRHREPNRQQHVASLHHSNSMRHTGTRAQLRMRACRENERAWSSRRGSGGALTETRMNVSCGVWRACGVGISLARTCTLALVLSAWACPRALCVRVQCSERLAFPSAISGASEHVG